MDLNYLYFRHQLSLMKAAVANGIEARASHRGLADLYAAAIHSARASRPSRGARPYLLSSRTVGSLGHVARA